MGILKGIAKKYLPKRIILFLIRLRTWFFILQDVKGQTFLDEVTLTLSSLIDSFWTLVFAEKNHNPFLCFDALVTVEENRFHVRGRSDDIWHIAPIQGAPVLNKFREILTEGSVFVDCGANIGGYAVFAAMLVGPNGTVVVIEMLDETIKVLQRNLALNDIGNANVIPRALGSESGLTLEATYRPGQYGPATVVEKGTIQSRLKSAAVETITLDDACANLDHIRLIKMDVECAEYDTLLCAPRTLERTDFLIFECWPQSPRKDLIFWLLRRAGFSISPLDETNYWAYREGR